MLLVMLQHHEIYSSFLCIVACTVGIGLVGQLAQVYNASIAHTLEGVCSLFKASPAYEKECEKLVEFSAPLIIDL